MSFLFQATKALRDMGVDTKILAVSACDDIAVKELFIEAGVNDFLAKPLTLDKLASFLQNMWSRNQRSKTRQSEIVVFSELKVLCKGRKYFSLC